MNYLYVMQYMWYNAIIIAVSVYKIFETNSVYMPFLSLQFSSINLRHYI